MEILRYFFDFGSSLDENIRRNKIGEERLKFSKSRITEMTGGGAMSLVTSFKVFRDDSRLKGSGNSLHTSEDTFKVRKGLLGFGSLENIDSGLE